MLPNVFASRMTELSAQQLWPFVSNPLLLPDLSSELQAVRVLGDPVKLGTIFEGDQQRGERRWSTTSTVTAFDPPRIFEWTVGDLEHPVSRWSFILDESAHGTTLTQRAVLCGGPSPLTQYITAHPDEAEDVVLERLSALRARMAITIEGLFVLARSAAS